MRISTAYFAGVGTVIVAVAAGLGGGYLAANIANPPARSFEAGTQDVGGADICCRGARAAGTACDQSDCPRRLRSGHKPWQQQRPPMRRYLFPTPRLRPTPIRAEERPVDNKSRNNIAAVQPAPQPARSIEPKSADPVQRESRRRRARRSQGPATPTLNARMRKSAASNGVRPGLNGAAFSNRVSRNSKQLKREFGKSPNRGGSGFAKKASREKCTLNGARRPAPYQAVRSRRLIFSPAMDYVLGAR